MNMANTGIEIPKSGEWPGTFESYKLVRSYVKINIWHFVSVIGIWLILSWVISFILKALFKNSIAYELLDNIASLFIAAFIQACFIVMYFYSLKDKVFDLKDILDYGYRHALKILLVLIVTEIILFVGFILLIIPFLIMLPRLYLAPYFLVADDLGVGEAIGFSWHLTKGHSKEIYGVIGLEILFALTLPDDYRHTFRDLLLAN